MPTFKVYKDGAEVETMRGASDQGLLELLNRAKAWAQSRTQSYPSEVAHNNIASMKQSEKKDVMIKDNQKRSIEDIRVNNFYWIFVLP